MVEPTPLPSSSARWVVVASALVALLALGFSLGLPTLRQGRLLDEGADACSTRTREALTWLEREESVAALLDVELTNAVALQSSRLSPDDSGASEPQLELLASQHGAELQLLRLGTRRAGSTLDTAPATAVFTVGRTSLPELLDSFYRQERIVRLVALDVELPRFGEDTIRTTLRWEYGAPSDQAVQPDDPALRWSPPVLLSRVGPGSVSTWNHGRWERLEEAAIALRSLAPRLERLAEMDAQRATLEEQRTAVGRWQEAQAAEQNAVQRRLPELLRRVDLSAEGKASLRPGTGGRLVVGDASGSVPE